MLLEKVAGPFDVVCQNFDELTVQVWTNHDPQTLIAWASGGIE